MTCHRSCRINDLPLLVGRPSGRRGAKRSHPNDSGDEKGPATKKGPAAGKNTGKGKDDADDKSTPEAKKNKNTSDSDEEEEEEEQDEAQSEPDEDFGKAAQRAKAQLLDAVSIRAFYQYGMITDLPQEPVTLGDSAVINTALAKAKKSRRLQHIDSDLSDVDESFLEAMAKSKDGNVAASASAKNASVDGASKKVNQLTMFEMNTH